MYQWNVRVNKIHLTFAEFIVEANTKEEAEAKINPETDVTDEHWNEDGSTEFEIQSDYTERMDELFPDDYDNPDENDGEHS
tara:strand:+ start:379 stop:621 length:243 start_codon:yes stop_codon:yes gene_type:complete